VQRRLKLRRRSMYEADCELLNKRQRRHDEIDKHMNEVRCKQHAAKMVSVLLLLLAKCLVDSYSTENFSRLKDLALI